MKEESIKISREIRKMTQEEFVKYTERMNKNIVRRKN